MSGIKRTRDMKGCLFFAAVFAFFCAAGTAYAQDKIVAVVNNEVITDKDFEDFISFTRLQMSEQSGERELDSRIDRMRSGLLDKMIEDRLIIQAARKNDIKIDENRVKARLKEIKSRYASTQEFLDDLMKHGLVQDDIERKIRDQLSMFTIVDQKVRDKIIVRPDEVTAYYNRHLDEFESPEERQLDVITANNEDTAAAVMHDLKRSVKIADIKVRYPVSVNSITAKYGSDLDASIEESVFALKAGEVSQPLLTGGKYYVFRVNSVIPKRNAQLGELQEKIHSRIFDDKLQEEMRKWIDELKTKAYIKRTQD